MRGDSLLDFLGKNRIRPLLLDWGNGAAPDNRLTLDEVILERLGPALDWLHHATGKRPIVLGYCMGGTLATALACLREDQMAGLALLATPWDFNGESHQTGNVISRLRALESSIGIVGAAPIDLLQTLFVETDPLNVPRKFARFAKIPTTSNAAHRFVAIEDWLNDGVALNAEVAAECFLAWYGDNAPARGAWQIDGFPVRPERLDLPSCLAIPERDRIVTPRSALSLASMLSRRQLIRPKGGHVSMVAGNDAKATLWDPLLLWLKGVAAMQESRRRIHRTAPIVEKKRS